MPRVRTWMLIPARQVRQSLPLEALGEVLALGLDRLAEPAVPEACRGRLELSDPARCVVVVDHEGDAVPVQHQGREEANARGVARERLGDVHDHGLGLPGREPEGRASGGPLALGRLGHHQRRHELEARRPAGRHVHRRIGPVEPPRAHQAQPLGGSHALGVEGQLEEVRLGEAQVLPHVALERRGVHVVLGRQRLGPVATVRARHGHRGERLRHRVQVLLRERREREALVGIDLHVRGVIDRLQQGPVEVGHLAQLLGELQLEEPVLVRDQLVPADEHVLVVVRRDQHARSHRQAQRGDAKDVADELVGLAVPGVEEGAGADQPLGLDPEGLGQDGHVPALDPQQAVSDPVGPRHAHDVRPLGVPEADDLEVALPEDPAIARSGTQLDDGADGLAVVLLADPAQPDPVVAGSGGPPDTDALGVEGHELLAQVRVEGEVEVADPRVLKRRPGAGQGHGGALGVPRREERPHAVPGEHEVGEPVEVHVGLAAGRPRRPRERLGSEASALLAPERRGVPVGGHEIHVAVRVPVGEHGLELGREAGREGRAHLREAPTAQARADPGRDPRAAEEQVHVLVGVEVLDRGPGHRASAGQAGLLGRVGEGAAGQGLVLGHHAGTVVAPQGAAGLRREEQVQVAVVVVVHGGHVVDDPVERRQLQRRRGEGPLVVLGDPDLAPAPPQEVPVVVPVEIDAREAVDRPLEHDRLRERAVVLLDRDAQPEGAARDEVHAPVPVEVVDLEAGRAPPVGQQRRTGGPVGGGHGGRARANADGARRANLGQGALTQDRLGRRLRALGRQRVPELLVALDVLGRTEVRGQEEAPVDGGDVPDRAVGEAQALDLVVELDLARGSGLPLLVRGVVAVVQGARQRVEAGGVPRRGGQRALQQADLLLHVALQVGDPGAHVGERGILGCELGPAGEELLDGREAHGLQLDLARDQEVLARRLVSGQQRCELGPRASPVLLRHEGRGTLAPEERLGRICLGFATPGIAPAAGRQDQERSRSPEARARGPLATSGGSERGGASGRGLAHGREAGATPGVCRAPRNRFSPPRVESRFGERSDPQLAKRLRRQVRGRVRHFAQALVRTVLGSASRGP